MSTKILLSLLALALPPAHFIIQCHWRLLLGMRIAPLIIGLVGSAIGLALIWLAPPFSDLGNSLIVTLIGFAIWWIWLVES